MSSLLLPRLPPIVADAIYGNLRSLDVEAVAACASTHHPGASFTATGGRQITSKELGDLRAQVLETATACGYPVGMSASTRLDFDRGCAQDLLDRLSLVAAEAAVRDVWAYMGAVLLPDVVVWRFPNPPRDRMLGTDLRRHTFARLWWRARTLREPDTPEPLHLFRALAEDDHIHLFEPTTLGGSPVLARTVAREIRSIRTRSEATVGTRSLVRDALKRVLRLTPFITFEALDEPARRDLVNRAFAAAEAALVGSERSNGAGPPDEGGRQPLQLEEYVSWRPGAALPPFDRLSSRDIEEMLVSVVEVEGPVVASRAYRVIFEGAGGARMQPWARRELNQALAAAIQQGRLMREDPPAGSGLTIDCVLRRPDQPRLRLRTAGPRLSAEIPPDELAEAQTRFHLSVGKTSLDAVSDAIGLDISDERERARLRQHAPPSQQVATSTTSLEAAPPAGPGRHELAIHATYKNQRVEGLLDLSTSQVRLINGPQGLRGRVFASPTEAAVATVRSINPEREHPETNGWRFWIDTESGGAIDSLRHS